MKYTGKEKKEYMNEKETREAIARMLAEADSTTLDELRVFIEYYLGVQDER